MTPSPSSQFRLYYNLPHLAPFTKKYEYASTCSTIPFHTKDCLFGSNRKKRGKKKNVSCFANELYIGL